jgi:Txe/YoeB family toxin of toxin-antitoxin system
MYKIIFTREAEKDYKKMRSSKVLVKKATDILHLMTDNPFYYPPHFEKLSGDLQGKYSRRLNIQHRLVYEVDDENKEIKVLSLWTHYE